MFSTSLTGEGEYTREKDHAIVDSNAVSCFSQLIVAFIISSTVARTKTYHTDGTCFLNLANVTTMKNQSVNSEQHINIMPKL